MTDNEKKLLAIENRDRNIEKLEGLFDEYRSVYGKYEKVEKIINRIERWVTYPSDKIKGLRVKNTFDRVGIQGLNQEKRDRRIIVSLTSYPKRIHNTPIAIASMLTQTVKPDKIILWLANEDFPDRKLPDIFEKIIKCGVEVSFRDDLKVHMKYYYAFKEFPDDLVITVDDDILYRNTLIEELYKSYQRYPKEIHAAYVNQLTFDDDGHLKGYEDWNFRWTDKNKKSSHQFMALGVGGVIYSPNLLCEEVLNTERIKTLCPTNDDIWLKFMEVKSGVKVRNVALKNTGTVLRDTQRGMALGIVNMVQGGNDRQLKAMINYYNNRLDNSNNLTLEERMIFDK